MLLQKGKKKVHIEMIKDERGQCWNNPEEVGMAFVNYFTNLFSAGQEGELEPCMHNVEGHVSASMNAELMREFTAEEIIAALHQMSPLKALGLDGLNACFFQNNWATMGRRYVELFLTFSMLG